MSEKLLVSFYQDWHYGDLSGLFIATQEELDSIVGTEVYFGECLGKHSEVVAEITMSDFSIISRDQDLIEQLLFIFNNSTTLSGTNPLSV